MKDILTAEDRNKFLPGLNMHYLSVDSSQLDFDIQYIIENNVENLMLIGKPYSTYDLHHLDWLPKVCHIIKRLIITPENNCNFSFDGLKSCTSLLKLKINNYSDLPIDLSCNLNLTELSLESCKKVTGIEELLKIESLILSKVSPQLLSCQNFQSFKNLKHLSLSNANLSTGLNFLKDSSLLSLDIFYCKKLSLMGIDKLLLTSFGIHNCKNIINFSSIFGMKCVKQIKIIDSAKIDSVNGFTRIGSLETLIVLGSSYFLDGDLSAIKGKLKCFNYDNKKHYNIKKEIFKKSFLSR